MRLGALVQAYVDEQCDVILDARAALMARDESVVHPTRVAIRRLRATLRTYGAVYDAESRSGFAQELRWMGLLLGDVRDLQVLAERFTGPDASTAAVARRVIGRRIRNDRRRAWNAVTAALDSDRGRALAVAVTRWRDDPPTTAEADRAAARALRRVDKAEARLRKRLQRARDASASGDDARALLHDARKAAKRHRYAVELAAPVLGADAEEIIERSKALQDALGEHQDAVVALGFLERMDGRSRSPETSEALTDLIASTRAQADDVAAVLSEAEHLRG
ncbi:CHAD domain-containing protein [Microbacterium sp. cf046]|uniref:CHAD domain-containing protein n=1 Tax=Microbacterium sp. cf046 TaxID=1761803 RepID=UPI0008E09FD4|nr:CHAD domain-containing protein [Microbacterium sp. cf046]SFS02028.1 CHAD domain-containing protein [Microbacterium sp. cf046]